MEITWVFTERKRGQVERSRKRQKVEEWGRERGKRKKGWPYRRPLPPTDTQALRGFSLGLQRREDWNSALPAIRTRI